MGDPHWFDPHWFLLQFDINEDRVCDDEFNDEITLSAFIERIQHADPSLSTRDLLNFDMLDTARSIYEDEQLLMLELKELALLSYPEESLPDNNSVADPNVKGIEKDELKAMYKKRQKVRYPQKKLISCPLAEEPTFEMRGDNTSKYSHFWQKTTQEKTE